MQVHKILIATLLAAGAVGAMSQELDPGETLQAKNLAAPRLHLGTLHHHDLDPDVAAVRRAEAASVQTDANAAPRTSWASRRATKSYARRWLHGDQRPARGVLVGDAG